MGCRENTSKYLWSDTGQSIFITQSSVVFIMKVELQQALEAELKNLNEEDHKKLKIHVLKRLIQKMKHDENSEIEQELENLIQQVPNSPMDRALIRPSENYYEGYKRR